ncbi:DUF2975 domain-containing protein [Aminipila luticellarii]|uniref:DUF2975 domain-containing protein n=1 Tax=Aminipila luticellarii TaxID=2507160 RepID=A0A410PTA2_9FIRM|nr:DUF2975 domain-containing protein [Aminipila luticellarii]QAT42197.1 DUF2975 domain-containing protein [Aminipila luticellarii]
MWNSNKSLQLSCICTRFVMVLVVVCAAALPYLIDIYLSIGPHYISEMDMGPFMVILYACCIPALAALFNLDRLLRNIKKEEVFTDKNVTCLRRISWCCFGAAVLVVMAGYYYFLFYFVAVVIAFIGLILRVVKNVIEQAVIIKAENDFTI